VKKKFDIYYYFIEIPHVSCFVLLCEIELKKNLKKMSLESNYLFLLSLIWQNFILLFLFFVIIQLFNLFNCNFYSVKKQLKLL